jgi:hypothetical protein
MTPRYPIIKAGRQTPPLIQMLCTIENMLLPMHKQMIMAVVLAATQTVQAQADTTLDLAVKAYVKKQGDDQTLSYKSALFDLNNDGSDDALVLLTGPDWCGSGGCTMLVFKGLKDEFKLVSSTSVTLEPIRVIEQTSSNGWASLIVHSRSHGEALLRFNGKKYPANPSTAPLASKAQLQAAKVVVE